jgi:hypothetical protein
MTTTTRRSPLAAATRVLAATAGPSGDLLSGETSTLSLVVRNTTGQPIDPRVVLERRGGSTVEQRVGVPANARRLRVVDASQVTGFSVEVSEGKHEEHRSPFQRRPATAVHRRDGRHAAGREREWCERDR